MKKILSIIIKGTYNALSKIKDGTQKLLYTFVGLFGHNRKRQAGSKVLVSSAVKVNVKKPSAAKRSTHRSAFKTKSKKVWWKSKVVIFATAAAIIAAVAITAAVAAIGGGDDRDRAIAAQSNIENAVSSELSESQEGSSANVSLNQNEVSLDTTSTEQTIQTTAPAQTPIPTTEPVDEDLLPGRSDARIIKIQERLMELGYMDYDEPSDYYGFGTEFALQLFQRKHGLQVDGILGDNTIDMLFSSDAVLYTVKIGDRGTDVASLQKRLQSLNYLKAGSTGYFGTDTEAAVKNFQKRNGLYADGNVGEQTREALYSADARAASTSSSSSGSSGSSTGNQPVVVGDPDNASADALIAFAITQLGKPYVRGGKGPDTFDCSGFVYYSLNSVGFKIRYMTSTTWRSADYPTITNMNDIKKGDILCFNGHVGIYMGDGRMIDASSSNGKIVIRSNIFASSYWTRNFRSAKRVF
ncbi:MAG: hypothetical protein HN389_07390 [Clostridia bacterium]|nr:hypothetical protein [Clostridia bacterium]